MKTFFKNLLPTIEILVSSIIVAYVGQTVDSWLTIHSIFSYWATLTGAVVLLFGIVVRIWATVAFSRNKVKVLQLSAPDTLVQDGPYAYSRNPLYVGIFCMVLGVALLLGSVTAVLFSVLLLFFANWWIQTREEPSLLKKFGDSYKNYLQVTRRWV